MLIQIKKIFANLLYLDKIEYDEPHVERKPKLIWNNHKRNVNNDDGKTSNF